jgi:hypothetical protein
MSFLFAYKQKESTLPEELRLKNSDVIFNNLMARYLEKLSKSVFLEELKSTLAVLYPSETCTFL